MPPKRYLVIGYVSSKYMDEEMGLVRDVLREDGGEIDACPRLVDKRNLADVYSAGKHSGLVIVGADGELDDPMFEQERRCIRLAIREDLPTLGICHGCQLIAYVHGAAIDQEIVPRDTGGRKISLSPDGKIDPVVSHLTPEMELQQNHSWAYRFRGNTPDYFAHLAYSCDHRTSHSEAFRIKTRIYGVQFHPEDRANKYWQAGRQLLANWKKLT